MKIDFAAETIRLPKFRPMRFACSRRFEGTVKTVTVSRDARAHERLGL